MGACPASFWDFIEQNWLITERVATSFKNMYLLEKRENYASYSRMDEEYED